jgi:hypothetical protein
MSDSSATVMHDFTEVMEAIRQDREQFWASLSKDQQLKAFCAVVERLAEAELDEQLTYRGVLYEKFGFGPDAYVRSQMSGLLRLHNSI